MMFEYKCVRIKSSPEGTEDMINDLAVKGWKVVCDYSLSGNYLILEREVFK